MSEPRPVFAGIYTADIVNGAMRVLELPADDEEDDLAEHEVDLDVILTQPVLSVCGNAKTVNWTRWLDGGDPRKRNSWSLEWRHRV